MAGRSSMVAEADSETPKRAASAAAQAAVMTEPVVAADTLVVVEAAQGVMGLAVTVTAGGGGSFNSGTSQVNTGPANSGHGQVTISLAN